MPGPSQILAEALEIPGEGGEEEVNIAVGALLRLAIKEEESYVPLARILQEIIRAEWASHLDPLDTLPLLLSSRDQAAKDLISLMGERSSAKEIIIAVQESMERLEISIQAEEDEDEVLDTKMLPLTGQLNTLICLYASAIPRLKLRRKTALETISPLLTELQGIIPLIIPRATRDDSRALIINISNLIKQITHWVATSIDMKNDDNSALKSILKVLLDSTIDSSANMIRSSLAQRLFELYFPRLTVQSALETGWEGGHEAIQNAIHAYRILENPINFLPIPQTTSSMVILAHSDIDPRENCELLSKMMPIILASIQTNSALDEALAILLKFFNPLLENSEVDHMPEVIIPLCTVIPVLSSSHPDPLVRHQSFRILSLVLSASSPPLRLQILNELTTDEDLPQMRVAAVGLVKEAVLDALTSSSNIFASPAFLQVFGPILFRPSPPDLLISQLSLDEFKNSSEPQRLTESLALYYVLLSRDISNKTGVRNASTMLNIENTLLKPLRAKLEGWLEDSSVSSGKPYLLTRDLHLNRTEKVICMTSCQLSRCT